MCPDLQVADNAVVLRPVQAASGGGGQVDSPSNQEVSCRGVTASVRAAVRGRWELLSKHTESCKWRVETKETMVILLVILS